MSIHSKTSIFLNSALTEENPFISTQEVIQWLIDKNIEVNVQVNKIRFSDMKLWKFSGNRYSLIHESGNFFSIDGIKIKTNYSILPFWEQPIINQPEIGYLGIITKSINNILYFLMQAKIEPGNVNNVQLSPTLQATRSNYLKVHKGKTPLYLEYFTNRKRCEIYIDQLQSEQGARFLQKRNRNIIINTKEDIPVSNDFVWLTLGQIKRLMGFDNLVNMDTRTVVSSIPYGNYSTEVAEVQLALLKNTNSQLLEEFLFSAINNDKYVNSIDNILAWFTEQKCKYNLLIEKMNLNDISDWHINEYEIKHKDEKYFKVIAADVEIGNREITHWTQPMVQPAQNGLIAFIIKNIKGVIHFLVQAKLECGNFDVLEMAPTVQCLTGNYRNSKEGILPFLETVLNVPESNIIYDTLQSEEGGRFYHEENRNLIIKVNEDFSEEIPDEYCWMTLNQLYSFLRYNNYLNIQARSLIAAVIFN
jgi:dTDP-4-dehydro-6-deoxy-alpha-D-glucopyranose 2,3-dehydratase